MIRHLRSALTVAILGGALLLTHTTGASAHVVQTFGPYSLAIGWLQEPAFVGELNGVQLIVRDAHGKPVTDLSATDMHAQVRVGSTTSARLDLAPTFDPDTGLGTPGEYVARLIPTVPGTYTFVLSADVHGTPINQSFSSSPTTFDSVHDAAGVEFPVAVPANSELLTRIARDAQRLEAAIQSGRSAGAAANRATILGIAALVIGLVGGGAALVAGRRSRPAAART